MAATDVSVHPRGLCESEEVGRGTRVWAFAHVMDGAVVGDECNVGDHAFVESGAVVGDRVTIKNGVMLWDKVTVEDDVFLGPGVVFTNDMRPRASIRRSGDDLVPTHVGPGATLGAGAVVVCGTTVGEGAFVAAGSVVTRDVAPYAFVAGNPAARRGWVCWCGQALDDRLVCECGRHFVAEGPERIRPA